MSEQLNLLQQLRKKDAELASLRDRIRYQTWVELGKEEVVMLQKENARLREEVICLRALIACTRFM